MAKVMMSVRFQHEVREIQTGGYDASVAIQEAKRILSETEPKGTLEEHKRTCNPRTCWIGQDGTAALAESLSRFLED